ncbi:hypothetical protein AAZV13_19G196600 [Glycine max]|uniref:uncharacterized protein n=1 Tax=Glycine max TaxID=3847 RepID=UPI0003DEBF2B|nr:uncharacterized protein LOC102660085 [Glycine max]|eukprot:XP_025982912.1 uncharacterized protein LOC102660085 [Glycine max]
MAPTKKPRTTTNKRFSSLSEVSPKKDEVGSSKNKQRVAENVSSRSVEMVKALHSISQFLAVPLANLAGFQNAFFMEKDKNLNSIVNLFGNITMNCGLVSGMDFQQIWLNSYVLDNE